MDQTIHSRGGLTALVIIIVLAIAVVLGGGYYLYAQKKSAKSVSSTTNTASPSNAPEVARVDFSVTFPEKGSTIESKTLEVKGQTKPNYQVWAYLDPVETITINTQATGTGQADKMGNFTIKDTSKALTPGAHILRVATAPDGIRTIDPSNITEVIFTVR